VDVLLLSEGLRKHRVSVECGNCGWKGTVTAEKTSEGVRCPKCGSEAEIKSDEDIIDESYEIADRMGTRVELISTESEEGEMLMTAFGGIAAILRFKPGG
jgi:peptide chain release factor subunit 1